MVMSIESNSSGCIDLIFPVRGSGIPCDHAYGLYSAVCRIATIHQAKDLGVFPIRGTASGHGTLLLNERSALRFRLPAGQLPKLLPLAGKSLEVDGHRLRVGVPHVAALIPAPALGSPLVLIKLAHLDEGGQVTPELFLAAARRKLTEMGIRAEVRIQLTRNGPRTGEVRRRVIRVKNQTHVGFAMVVHGLAPAESIQLQEQGLGGRRLMGCGLFLPMDLAKETQ